MGYNYNRIYDRHMPVKVRDIVRERRKSPDGVERKIRAKDTPHGRMYNYPWDQMKLGDFFIAPCTEKNITYRINGFHAAARRRDWEITCKRITDNKVRVALTYIGVSTVSQQLQENQ